MITEYDELMCLFFYLVVTGKPEAAEVYEKAQQLKDAGVAER